MNEIPAESLLVGTRVENAARPEWGVGQVLRVQRLGGKALHRVSIQFAIGHRAVMVPPARLIAPRSEPRREAGWLTGLGRRTLDDRLRALPECAIRVLGTPLDRLAAVIPLYALSDGSESLLRWARAQTGVADPLSLWTRDELLAAWRDFRSDRDAHLRSIAAHVQQAQGPQALEQALAALPETLREAVLAALRRPIS